MSMFRRSIVSLLAFCLFSTIAVPNVMAASYWTRVYTGGPAYGPTQSTVTGTYVTYSSGIQEICYTSQVKGLFKRTDRDGYVKYAQLGAQELGISPSSGSWYPGNSRRWSPKVTLAAPALNGYTSYAWVPSRHNVVRSDIGVLGTGLRVWVYDPAINAQTFYSGDIWFAGQNVR